jgi:cytochrome c biogenesis protein CcmG/thiol:disulfide interchange protein DsbE
MKKHLFLPLVGFAVLVFSVLFYFGQSTNKNNSKDEVSSLIFETPDFYNNKLINENTMGDFYIVNFFASWCKPCLAEHPLLMEMKKKDIKIIGINFRDDEENFKEWINEHGNPFEYILIDDGTIAYEMGLIGVPETFFIFNKIIQKKVQGPLFYEDVEKYL